MLCTIVQVKARLFPAGVTDTADDTLLTELVEEVSAWIQGYTGRAFVPETAATYTFDTSAGYVIRIPRGIRTVTSMGIATLAHQPDTGGVYTTVPAASILLRPLTGDRPAGWPATEVRLSRGSTAVSTLATIENGATITGNFGFATTPLDIAAVAIDATVAAYQSRKNGASSVLGADDLALPPWSGFFGRGSPQRGTLERYRYVGIG